ncbi:hypothetical protein CLAVI_000590 [Candidatus Clavichlamydia salmonicola]|uniref:hypothetical protein n=1 Tax=Candidatus Clavichlamydia salmonicola TaxID=469812 RepID=UPI001890F510|nr:hypothetical protein [Candidatus Clavichlamydia salmonicola]MBF5050967.1 hypothetical protein [Candidatus Clavichlamydia salmonicola]
MFYWRVSVWGCSAVKFVVAVVDKGIRLCLELSTANLDEKAKNRHIFWLIEDMFACLIPEVMAGFMGMEYGCVVAVESTARSPAIWVIANGIVGGLSCGLYILDMGIALWDIVSLDVKERDRRAAQVKRYLRDVLQVDQLPGYEEERMFKVQWCFTKDQYEGYAELGSWLPSFPHNPEVKRSMKKGDFNDSTMVFCSTAGDVILKVLMVVPVSEDEDDGSHNFSLSFEGAGQCGKIVQVMPDRFLQRVI